MIRTSFALAALMTAALFATAAPASAGVCTSDCTAAYTACSSANGANGQQVCQPKWMQCRKACAGPVAPAKTTPVKLTTTPAKPIKVAVAVKK